MALAISTEGDDSTGTVFQELREALASVHVGLEVYEKNAEAKIQTVTRKTRAEFSHAKAELSALQERLDKQAGLLAKKREVAALERSRAELQPAIDRIRREAALRKSRGEAECENLNIAMRRFARFGLDFEGTPDGALKLTFKLLDRHEPDRAFCASIVVNDRDCYELKHTYPTLPKPTLTVLVNEVNRTNDFSFFVRRLRHEFQTIVAVYEPP